MLLALLLANISVLPGNALPALESSILSSPSPSQCDSSSSTRSISGIVWSCLTTIFCCTYLAVHPNIPAQNDSYWTILRRRARILFVALIAPEFIILWALNQLSTARRAVATLRRYEACEHWTLTHGMFLVMGGFMLVDDKGLHLGVILVHDMNRLVSQNRVSLPSITSSEIEDRSKGDALAKALVLLQTTWFMTQVIFRAIQHLPITELELTTVAFASLNALTYVLWWKKPLDVRHPILVPLSLSGQTTPIGQTTSSLHFASELEFNDEGTRDCIPEADVTDAKEDDSGQILEGVVQFTSVAKSNGENTRDSEADPKDDEWDIFEEQALMRMKPLDIQHPIVVPFIPCQTLPLLQFEDEFNDIHPRETVSEVDLTDAKVDIWDTFEEQALWWLDAWHPTHVPPIPGQTTTSLEFDDKRTLKCLSDADATDALKEDIWNTFEGQALHLEDGLHSPGNPWVVPCSFQQEVDLLFADSETLNGDPWWDRQNEKQQDAESGQSLHSRETLNAPGSAQNAETKAFTCAPVEKENIAVQRVLRVLRGALHGSWAKLRALLGSFLLVHHNRPYLDAIDADSEPWRERVHTFDGNGPEAGQYSALVHRSLPITLEMLIGALFGGVHCAGWMFQFPSQVERVLWRTTSLYITLAPVFLWAFFQLVLHTTELSGRVPWSISWVPGFISHSRLVHLVFIVYILARLATFVLAFELLRELPPGALQQVQWLTYVPHI